MAPILDSQNITAKNLKDLKKKIRKFKKEGWKEFGQPMQDASYDPEKDKLEVYVRQTILLMG